MQENIDGSATAQERCNKRYVKQLLAQNFVEKFYVISVLLFLLKMIACRILF